MELALARRPVAERAQRDAAFSLELGRVRDAGGFGDPACDHLRDRRDLQLAVAIAAAGDVPPRGEWITRLGKDSQHPLLHRQAAHDRIRQAAVVRHEPVVGTDRSSRRDLDALMSAARADEWSPALLDEDVPDPQARNGIRQRGIDDQGRDIGVDGAINCARACASGSGH